MKKLFFLVYIVITFIICGCGTPNVVKSLSEEQLKVQIEAKKNLAKYFEIIEDVFGRQITVNISRSEERQKTKLNNIKLNFLEDISSATDTNKIVEDFIENIKTEIVKLDHLKIQYDQRKNDLKTKHRQILEMMDEIIVAQETLNTYLQLEKVDEVLGEELLSVIGISQEKIKNYTNDISDILTKVKKIKGE